jgi:multidrug resistance efflux pump
VPYKLLFDVGLRPAFCQTAFVLFRELLKNPLNRLGGWMKRHLLVSTGLIVFAVFLLFEIVTTFVVVCRDAYVTTDLAIIAPDVSGPMMNLAISNDQVVRAGELLFTIDPKPFQIHAGRVMNIAPGIARSTAAISVLPYFEPNTDWIRLPRRFPVEIDVGDHPKTRNLFMGADATVWWINW